jgi:sec-independent protein translocase protein TatC
MTAPPPDAPTPTPGAAEMPFLDHLEELRWRLVYSLAALAVGLVIAFALLSSPRVNVIGILAQPVQPYLKPGQTLVYTHPGDVFSIVLNASLVLGLLIASPVIIYQVWAFLSPALYTHEKKVVIPVLLGAVLLFAGGVALAFKVVLPITLGFLLTFQTGSLTPMLTAGEYFGFATSMSLALGAVFELPILILGLTALGFVTPALLTRFRRHAVIGCVVVAAFITPGADPTSLFVLAGPLYLLYEVSVILSAFVYRRRERREREREAAEAAALAAEQAAADRLTAQAAATDAAFIAADAAGGDAVSGDSAARDAVAEAAAGPRRLVGPPSGGVPLDQTGL